MSLIELQSHSLQNWSKKVLEEVISCEFGGEKIEQLFNGTPLDSNLNRSDQVVTTCKNHLYNLYGNNWFQILITGSLKDYWLGSSRKFADFSPDTFLYSRSVFRTVSTIKDGAFCENETRKLFLQNTPY